MRSRSRKAPPPARPADGGQRPPGSALSQVREPVSGDGLNGHAQRTGAAPGATQRPAPRSDPGLWRGGLKNWRVRSRLLLLIVIPTLTALGLAGTHIFDSARSALAYQRVLQLATLTSNISGLVQNLEDERDRTAYFIALGPGVGGRGAPELAADAELQVVQSQWAVTDNSLYVVRADLAKIGSGFTSLTQQEAVTALADLQALGELRSAATETQLPVLQVVEKYTGLINNLLVLEDATVEGASDPSLSQSVHVLGLVSRMEEDASQQRAILTAALIQGQLGPAELAALNSAEADQNANLNSFELSASASEKQLWQNSVAASFVPLAAAEEDGAIALAQNNNGSLAAETTTADDWYGAMSNAITYQMGSVERDLTSSITSRAATLRNSAAVMGIVIAGVILVVLGLALLFTLVIARSMVRPLRRLRAGALEVAGVRLPETVRRMSESEGAAEPPEIEPIDVDSADEIGEVARAFEQVHREAVRLAANEAALRGNVNAMFVNLSRRSQSLVERQIRLIDDLEQGEQDAERLANLFQMDHLATRMRRNSENLLVLAGHEVSRRWTQAVALVDVLRAAVSEIEQYSRVNLNVQPGIAVRGQAVNDVVHLIAELVENATSFSAADTPVNVSGHLLNSGGVLAEITDQGVGMGAEEMAHANWRLDNPPEVDVAVSRRMGLFVVARLAGRHGIRVRLRPAALGGLTALVWLPDEVISHENAVTPAGIRRLEASSPGLAAAPTATTSRPAIEDWPTADSPPGDRAAAARAVDEARTPRFAPLRPDLGDTAAFAPVDPGLDPAAERGSTAPAEQARSSFPSLESASAGELRPGEPSGPGSGSEPGPAAASTPPSTTTGPLPALGASVNGLGRKRFEPADDAVIPSFRTESGPAQQGVIVPPAVSGGEENRLPIFESVESDWFRRGRHGADPAAVSAVSSGDAWSSPGDEGWLAAQVAQAPKSGGLTSSGLPKRVPRANLVPGTVGADPAAVPARSAAQTRDRLASFQRGIRDARAAARGDDISGDEDDSGT